MKTKERKILESARQVALNAETWADLSNALFDPDEGLVARAYPSRAARVRFMKTAEYRAIRGLIDAAQERTGFVQGATPRKKSGRVLVRLPISLHGALEAEAKDERVSLNQLIVTKLAMRLSKVAAG